MKGTGPPLSESVVPTIPRNDVVACLSATIMTNDRSPRVGGGKEVNGTSFALIPERQTRNDVCGLFHGSDYVRTRENDC